jgi:hypothetical protein
MSKGRPKENRLVVGDAGWAETLPDWLLEEVKSERIILGLVGMMNPDLPKVGDAEVCVFLYTSSLRAPMSSEHTQIYLYLGAKLMKRRLKNAEGEDRELPEMMVESIERGLTDWEEKELEDLRDMLYRKRGGEIAHPVLDAMRMFQKICTEESEQPQLSLF